MSTDHPTHKILSTCLIGLLCAAPTLALAHGPPNAMISINNRFDGEAEVYFDGRYQGIVAGDTTATFSVKPDCIDVLVKRPGTGFPLASTELHLAPGTTTVLPIAAPTTSLQVKNTGEMALKVNADGGAPLWIQPGTTAVLAVESGNVDLDGVIHDPRGDWLALERTLWVEPGQPTLTTLKPDPAVLVISNYERVPVHALLDGRDIGWINPGDCQRTWVRPGTANIVLLDRHGRVRNSTSVVARRGQPSTIVLNASPPVVVRPPPVVILNATPAPGVVINASWSPGRPIPVGTRPGEPLRGEPPCHD